MAKISILSIEFATPEYDSMIQLRTAILRTPLGLTFHTEDLAKEYKYHHLVAYDEKLNMVGCLVLAPIDDHTVQMKQVAVSEEVQGQGIGKALVFASENYSKEHGFKEMVLHARAVAVPFYDKLNYKKVGKPFEEVSIKHYKMKKSL